MVEDAPKGLFGGIADKIREKIGAKAADWLWDLLKWAAPVLLGWLVVPRRWLANEWDCINKPWCEVSGWSLGMLIGTTLLLVVVVVFLLVVLLKARHWIQDLQSEPQQAFPTYSNPIIAEDHKLMLRWYIRRPSHEWLHWRNVARTVSPGAVAQVLDGPFHAAEGCNAPLSEIPPQSSILNDGQPTFSVVCLSCGQQIFRSDVARHGVNVWPVRAAALEELQRMHRNGTKLEDRPIRDRTIVLEKPAYWNVMQSPK